MGKGKAGQKKRRADCSARLFMRLATVAGGILLFYFPDFAVLAAVCEFALGMLTYPLIVSLPTLLITISSGIFVPET